jgi:putative hydrolase of HD superfamily
MKGGQTRDLDARMAFLMEADRLKGIGRATRLADGSRFENSAEHSWHLALFALVLTPHAPPGVDRDRVIRMILIHDLVEIDAGDAPVFGAQDGKMAEAERAAADRLFGMLPAPQGAELRALWDEFEAERTPDARFAKALDRFQPPNQNLANGGGSWTDYAVDEETVRRRVSPSIRRGAPALWAWLSPRLAAFFAR